MLRISDLNHERVLQVDFTVLLDSCLLGRADVKTRLPGFTVQLRVRLLREVATVEAIWAVFASDFGVQVHDLLIVVEPVDVGRLGRRGTLLAFLLRPLNGYVDFGTCWSQLQGTLLDLRNRSQDAVYLDVIAFRRRTDFLVGHLSNGGFGVLDSMAWSLPLREALLLDVLVLPLGLEVLIIFGPQVDLLLSHRRPDYWRLAVDSNHISQQLIYAVLCYPLKLWFEGALPELLQLIFVFHKLDHLAEVDHILLDGLKRLRPIPELDGHSAVVRRIHHQLAAYLRQRRSTVVRVHV